MILYSNLQFRFDFVVYCISIWCVFTHSVRTCHFLPFKRRFIIGVKKSGWLKSQNCMSFGLELGCHSMMMSNAWSMSNWNIMKAVVNDRMWRQSNHQLVCPSSWFIVICGRTCKQSTTEHKGSDKKWVRSKLTAIVVPTTSYLYIPTSALLWYQACSTWNLTD